MGTIGTNARRATKIILQQWWKQGNKFPKFTHCCKIIFWIKTAHNLLLLTYRSSKDKEKDNQLKSLNHCADWGRSTTDIYDFSTKVCNSILILLNLWHGTAVLSCFFSTIVKAWKLQLRKRENGELVLLEHPRGNTNQFLNLICLHKKYVFISKQHFSALHSPSLDTTNNTKNKRKHVNSASAASKRYIYLF